MQKISILGAGRSSWYLLDYLNRRAAQNQWKMIVADRDEESLKAHTKGFENIETLVANVANPEELKSILSDSFLVISLLPPQMHATVAAVCLVLNAHLATASYVSKEMQAMDSEAKRKGLIFLNETGLDPGIDHMSAMKMLDEIRSEGGVINSFESYCGGLVMEEDCAGNPWKYKFSWNPMNVILAGQGGQSVYRKNGEEVRINPELVFSRSETLEIPDYGALDAYPNRDSLGYVNYYGLENAHTVLRGTLRRKGYCKAWQVLVKLGFTNNSKIFSGEGSMLFLSTYLTGKPQGIRMAEWLRMNALIDPEMMEYFDFLDLDSATLLSSDPVTPAALLRLHLEQKWKLNTKDRDEVLMYHRVGYSQDGQDRMRSAFLRVVGRDSLHTAMAKTVGLPLAMSAELIARGMIKETGVRIPVSKAWYGAVLPLLQEEGIGFTEYHQ